METFAPTYLLFILCGLYDRPQNELQPEDVPWPGTSTKRLLLLEVWQIVTLVHTGYSSKSPQVPLFADILTVLSSLSLTRSRKAG